MRRSFLLVFASLTVSGAGLCLLTIALGGAVVVALTGAGISLFGGIGSAWSISAR